jgi:replicative DNA helicase
VNAAARALAAVAVNKDIISVIAEPTEMFAPYSEVFEFTKDYYLEHKEVPSIAVINGKFPDADLQPVEGATAHHLNELRNEFLRGRMKQILQKADESLDVHSAEEVLDKVVSTFAGLSKYTQGSYDLDIMDVEKAIEDYKERKRLIDSGAAGFMTGFEAIDLNFPTGLAGGQLNFSIGYSGKGKSMFSNKLAINAVKQGRKVLIANMEMTAEEQRDRIYTLMAEGELDLSELAGGKVSIETFAKWTQNNVKPGPGIIVVDGRGINDVTPNLLQGKIDKHGVDFLIFDYMQLGMNNARSTEMTPRMMNLSRELKTLATRNNIPVWAISAVTDDGDKKRDAPPHLGQMSWSRQMEYDAHLIVAVHRYEDSNVVEIAARKNRNGLLFNMQYEVDFAKGIWTPILDDE